MDDMTKQVVFGVLAPVLIAAGIVLSSVRAKPSLDGRDRFGWRISLALAAPIVLAFFSLYGWPREQWTHLTFVPLAALPIAVAMSLAPRRAVVHAGGVVILGAVATAAIWTNFHDNEPTWYRAIPFIGVVGFMVISQPIAARRVGGSVPFALALTTVTTAVVVFQTGFLKLTVPFMALAASLVVVGCFSGWRRTRPLADGALAIASAALMTGALVAWLNMLFNNEDNPAERGLLTAALLVAVFSPAALWLAELRAIRDRSAWVSVPVRLGCVAVVCAVAIWLTFLTGESNEGPDPYAEFYSGVFDGP